ncbi:putative transcriptional regulator [Pontibacillus litoralis JSM 072002]|uniref:Putative transcriptional regulator n=1 Tax=Pontibacillus litoralis JSM 072002 TaxID=1385512 RepID=A0A0A5G411_9BACI|nr:putative transcriptional regulator [Pontibacillus litoralis JSM 072002]
MIKKRKELNLNQTELAKKAGLQAPAISQYESGSRNPSYDALVKLSRALKVSIDYLVSGSDQETQISDPSVLVLLKIFKGLEADQQKNILDYVFLSAGTYNILDYYANDPKQYANYIYEQVLEANFPVDIYKVLTELNLKVVQGEIENQAEAILLKRNNTVILNKNTSNEARVKRTLATLIGHYVMPWHIKSTYYYRKKGNSTTKAEDIEEIEAASFATNLITPSEILEADLANFTKGKVSLTNLKKLAVEKYKVSLTSLCYRLVEYDNDRFAVIQSSDLMTKQVFTVKMMIKEGKPLHKDSKAYELLDQPSNIEELKEGHVSASTWLDNFEGGQLLYESSIYNPEYNAVLTLLSKF